MKQWVVLGVSLLLAACGGEPRVILTSGDSHAVELLVQGARFVPLQDVEHRATRHCADYGLTSHRIDAAWVDNASMTFRFACGGPPKPAEKLADKNVAEPRKGSVVKIPAEQKQAAWTQANAMSSGWAKCVVEEATRMARASSDRAEIAAIAAAAGCSVWEHDIHQVLRQAGEQDYEFQADLHKQVIEFAAARIVAVRALIPLAVNE